MNGDYNIKVNALESGILMGIINKERRKVPRVWEQLMALHNRFRQEAGVWVEDMGDGMVKLTDKDGTVIIRQKYDWE